MQPVIGAIAARLTGSATIRLWDDQLVQKAPAVGSTGPVVGWHTDRAYWMTCTSEEMLTAWIPFRDCPEEIGPVLHVSGSHRWPERRICVPSTTRTSRRRSSASRTRRAAR